jgi:hypothetical protein
MFLLSVWIMNEEIPVFCVNKQIFNSVTNLGKRCEDKTGARGSYNDIKERQSAHIRLTFTTSKRDRLTH